MIVDWELEYKSKLHNYSLKPQSYILINGSTAHEFMIKWKELMTKYNNDTEIVWSKIMLLFDCKIIPVEEHVIL
jgi:hypothetical protein